MTSGLESKLRAGNFVVTAELSPPLSSDPRDLLETAKPLAQLADAINVTDGPSARVNMSALAAAGILVLNGHEPILQLTCRDRNRIALQSDLIGAAALGIRNLLILTGDHPQAGDQPEAKPVFDLDSLQLIETAVAIRDRSELPSGRKVGGHADFFIGVADTPLDPPPHWAPVSLHHKIAAGAQFLQTQFCMDRGVACRYIKRLVEEGITERVFVLIGVAPLVSARAALWIRQHLPGSIIPDVLIERLAQASDPRIEGKKICLELLHELAEIPGLAGVHLMGSRDSGIMADVIAAARSSTTRL